jgi:CSLREA domain-containing protein
MKKVWELPKKTFVWLAFLVLSAAVNAAAFTVTKTADTNDGVCNADCSLREAFAAAETNGSGVLQRIEFSAFFDTPRTIELSSRIFSDSALRIEIIGRGNHNVTLTGAREATTVCSD